MSGTWHPGFFGYNDEASLPTGNQETLATPDDMCYHDWVDYKGFTEDYKYCLKCDAKHWGKHPAMLGSKKKETKDESN